MNHRTAVSPSIFALVGILTLTGCWTDSHAKPSDQAPLSLPSDTDPAASTEKAASFVNALQGHVDAKEQMATLQVKKIIEDWEGDDDNIYIITRLTGPPSEINVTKAQTIAKAYLESASKYKGTVIIYNDSKIPLYFERH